MKGRGSMVAGGWLFRQPLQEESRGLLRVAIRRLGCAERGRISTLNSGVIHGPSGRCQCPPGSFPLILECCLLPQTCRLFLNIIPGCPCFFFGITGLGVFPLSSVSLKSGSHQKHLELNVAKPSPRLWSDNARRLPHTCCNQDELLKPPSGLTPVAGMIL